MNRSGELDRDDKYFLVIIIPLLMLAAFLIGFLVLWGLVALVATGGVVLFWVGVSAAVFGWVWRRLYLSAVKRRWFI